MLILGGVAKEVPGLVTKNWRDDRTLSLKMGEDGRTGRSKRKRRIRVHTTCGIPGGRDQRPQLILPGYGEVGNAAENNARYWSGSSKSAGAQLIVDRDGSVVQTCDLDDVAFHVPGDNNETIGIEVVQRKSDASLHEGQLANAAVLVLWLCEQYGIQFQGQWPYDIDNERLHLQDGGGPVGVFAHYHGDHNRGRGDCGAAMWDALAALGMECLDFRDPKKIEALWKARQRDLGVLADGDPGPATVAALRAAGYRSGLHALGRI